MPSDRELTPRQLPRQNPAFEPGKALSREVRRVWELCDGLTAVDEISEIAGVAPERVLEILGSLRHVGAVLLPGESPHSLAERVDEWDRKKHITDEAVFPEPPPAIAPESLSPEEREAMEAPVELTPWEKRRVLAVLRQVRSGDRYDTLEVTREAGAREIKRAFLRLSKEFHPDRHFDRNLGPFAPWLAQIFQGVQEAFELLSSERKRKSYDDGLAPDEVSQTREEHARDLFDRGCALERTGEPVEALKYFAAAIGRDPRQEFLRRAARCALAAGRASEAEDYARFAASMRPTDPSTIRLLAHALRATGDQDGARRALERALELSLGNEQMLGEIRADLDALAARSVGSG